MVERLKCMVRSFDEIKHVPQFAGIYGFKGATDKSGSYSYIGLSGKLRDRISQHLLRRDSSVSTGVSAVSLNPDNIDECHWWIHESFEDRDYLEAAELVAFEFFRPTLVSRGNPTSNAIEIMKKEEFKDKMYSLFSTIPSGYIRFYDISWTVEKIKELEKEINELKKKFESE